MYFRLTDNTALRRWKYVPYAYYKKGLEFANRLTKDEFEFMRLCDGEHDLEPSELSDSLIRRGLIRECEKGEHNSQWSAYREYENRHFPRMNFMITGKCNFNCLHCFNAADNSPLMTEWSYEDAIDLLDQARDCGINAITITGGEPMLHPRFMDIVKAIFDRGMFIEDLNTNGYFLTQQKLDEFKRIGCDPLIKISFDGIGCHDWIRNRKGAEEKALAAMELCVQNGFRVMSQTQVHRRNIHSLMDTAYRLGDIGVRTLRLIRTTETARWAQNAPESCLPLEEYYEKMLDFAVAFKDSGIMVDLIIWQYLRVHPHSKTFSIDPVKCHDGNYKADYPACKGIRNMVGVTSSGEAVPCLQLSGTFEERGVRLGNLHTTPLKELLTEGKYLEAVCTSIGDNKTDPKCAQCGYFKYCNGGCPALGFLFVGAMNGFDPSKCAFFENGWYQKTVERLGDWKNLTAIDEFDK